MKLGTARDNVAKARKCFMNKVQEALVPRLMGHLFEINIDLPPLEEISL